MSRYAYPASSSREYVSFHGSAAADDEMRKIIEEEEVAEGKLVGMIHLGRYVGAGNIEKATARGNHLVCYSEWKFFIKDLIIAYYLCSPCTKPNPRSRSTSASSFCFLKTKCPNGTYF